MVQGGDYTIMGVMPHIRSGDVEQIVRELFFTRFGFRCTTVTVQLGGFNAE
jgi:hypothetical protein